MPNPDGEENHRHCEWNKVTRSCEASASVRSDDAAAATFMPTRTLSTSPLMDNQGRVDALSLQGWRPRRSARGSRRARVQALASTFSLGSAQPVPRVQKRTKRWPGRPSRP